MFEQAMHSIVSKRWPLILMMDRTLHGRPKKTKTMMIGRSEATSEQSGAQSPIQAGSLLFHCSPFTKGRFWLPNWMHFWRSYKGGVGGSFSIQKFVLQILGTLNRVFWDWNCAWWNAGSSSSRRSWPRWTGDRRSSQAADTEQGWPWTRKKLWMIKLLLLRKCSHL